jgi:formylglycine-generating enzyme required for sulfatase activity
MDTFRDCDKCEYVARAGTSSVFWWGSNVSPGQANYDSSGEYGSYAGSQKAGAKNRTVPVNSYKANPFGLYNVHGNVFEWVEDCWHPDYKDARADTIAMLRGKRLPRSGS